MSCRHSIRKLQLIHIKLSFRHIHSSPRREDFYKFVQKSSQYSEPVFKHSTLKQLLNKCKSVSDQIEVFDNYVKLSEKDVAHRVSVCQYIENVFKPTFPDSSLYLVGSSVNELGMGGCDMDLTFQLSGNQNTPIQFNKIANADVSAGKIPASRFFDLTAKQQLLFLQILLKENGLGESSMVVPGRIPILNFHCNGLSCDLSTNNRSAINGTNFMKACVNSDPRLAPLCRLILYWGKRSRIIGGVTKLKSYSMFLMVVYFLQTRHPPVLLPVHEIFLKSEFQQNVENYSYDVNLYADVIPPSDNSETIETLLRDFFFFYMNFDFSSIICPLNATLVDGKNYLMENPTFELNTISIQDPLFLNVNVAANVYWKCCRSFMKALLFVCNIYHQNSFQPTIDNEWGISNLIEAASGTFSISKEKIEMEIPLRTSIEHQNNKTECFRTTTEKIFKILEYCLLFQLNQNEPTANSTTCSNSNIFTENCNTASWDGTKMHQNEVLYSQSSKCIASTAWMGRSNYSCGQSYMDEKMFLDTEQDISKEILSKNTKEDKEEFHFICECNGFYKNSNAYLNVNFKSPNRNIFMPKLGIFLKEYIFKYANKYL